jgi:hypothetical protein
MYSKDSAMDISRNNYETSFLLYLDRELGPAEMLKVEKFLTENPDLLKEFELLQQTIFLPEDIVFDQKELLLHKKGKRWIIPMYWVRIAASVLIVITAGWYILTMVLNNHRGEIAGNNRNPSGILPETIKKDSVNKDVKNNNQGDQTGREEIVKNKNQINNDRGKGVAKNIQQPNKYIVKKIPDKINTGELNGRNNTLTQTADANSNVSPVTDESLDAIKKSDASLKIHPDRLETGTDPKQVSVQPASRTAAPLLVTAGSRDQLKNENADLKENNNQTENAISVVALNDQNNAIKGFFKKITKHNPVDDKANNARTVHVSVFQFSY